MLKNFSYENSWVRNIVFYTIMLGIFFIQNEVSPGLPGTPKPRYSEEFIFFTSLYLVIYSFNYFAIGKLLFLKKFKLFAIVSIGYIFTFASVITLVTKWRGYPTSYFGEIFTVFFILLIGGSINIVHKWIVENVISTKRKLVRKEAELDFLKQQLSPHFLFNALNNLYGTALTAPQLTTEKILELSNLLRYQIESTTKESVKIEKELDFIQCYLNYTNYKTNNLVVTNEGTDLVKGIQLPPLLFLPLLENAIKYSAETEAPFIHIQWNFENKVLSFNIENSYRSNGSVINGTKVGFDNLKKRLEILKIKHLLEIDKGLNNVFKINLKLWGLSTSA